jgi:hypothetical protein
VISLALWVPFAAGQQPATPVNPPAAGTTPQAKAPEAIPAKGGDTEWSRLAQHQGKADTAILDWVLGNSGPLKGDARSGELRVAFTITPAEGWWDKAGGGKLAWHDAPDGNVHLRIFVLDAADGRLVPGLSVSATLVDANGNEQSVPADFGWYPLINAYGGNIPLDTDSSYTLRVTVDSTQPHHVFGLGERSPHSTSVEFAPVQISLDAVSAMRLASEMAYANEAELLKPCNAALSAAITALWKQSLSGAEQPFGDYFVGYALDFSGLAMPIRGAKLHVKNMIDLDGKNSVRVVVLPRDSRSGRLIPGLKPQASLIAADGKLYGPGELPLTWHPWLNHYGRGTRIPRKEVYKLHVHFEAPSFRRWGRQSERFASPADVEFGDVALRPETKPPEAKPKPAAIPEAKE